MSAPMASSYSATGGTSWSFGLGIGTPTVDSSDVPSNQNNSNVSTLLAENFNSRMRRYPSHSDGDDVGPYDAHTAAQVENSYMHFEKGFSDDDSGSGDELFHHVFKSNARAKSINPGMRQRKSPRRSDDDDLENILRTKKHKSSNLGGPVGFDDRANSEVTTTAEHQGHISIFGGTTHQTDEIHNTEQSGALNQIIPQPPPSPEPSQGDENQPPAASKVSPCFDLSLSDALSDYQGSPVPPSEHSYQMPDELRKDIEQNPYELRTGLNRNIPGAWMDRDQSGNFDPEDERKKAQLKRAQMKERKKKGKQPQKVKERIPKLIVRLKFEAIGTVLNITDEEQNWPDDWSDIDSEDERERLARRAFYRQNTPGVETQTPIHDPAQLVDDLTGHPAARGCENCRIYEDLCSMTTGSTWPCRRCANDQIDCVPIMTPKAKGKCNRCAETCAEDEENYCSFEMAGIKPHAICLQCVEEDYVDCVPGVPEDYKTPRMDLDEIMYGKNRKFATCTNCRATGKKCSVKTKAKKGPCNQCKRLKIGCTFYETPPKLETLKSKKLNHRNIAEEKGESSRNGATTREVIELLDSPIFTAEDLADLDDTLYLSDNESDSHDSNPEIELEDAQGHKGVTARIDTSFAHPVRFNVLPTETSLCNFCEVPVFGFVGYFEKSVYVIRWYNGLGYSELQSGHREEYDETIMCQECTSHRLQTIICENHDIRAMEERDKLPEFDVAAELLMLAEPGSATMWAQLKRWCSMCFTPASFKCYQPQPSICSGEDGNEKWIEGCGLALCNECEARRRSEFNGNCHDMIAVLDTMPKAKPSDDDTGAKGVVRADVGFLKPDGFLMRTVEADAEAMD